MIKLKQKVGKIEHEVVLEYELSDVASKVFTKFCQLIDDETIAEITGDPRFNPENISDVRMMINTFSLTVKDSLTLNVAFIAQITDHGGISFSPNIRVELSKGDVRQNEFDYKFEITTPR